MVTITTCPTCGGVVRTERPSVTIGPGWVRGDNHLLSREQMADALMLSEALKS